LTSEMPPVSREPVATEPTPVAAADNTGPTPAPATTPVAGSAPPTSIRGGFSRPPPPRGTTAIRRGSPPFRGGATAPIVASPSEASTEASAEPVDPSLPPRGAPTARRPGPVRARGGPPPRGRGAPPTSDTTKAPASTTPSDSNGPRCDLCGCVQLVPGPPAGRVCKTCGHFVTQHSTVTAAPKKDMIREVYG
jgi:hypothetical protein